MLKSSSGAALATVLLALSVAGAGAETCTRETLRKVVDETGARLRVLTAENQPRIMASLRRLKEKRGWTGSDGDDKAAAVISDTRTAELDSKASELLARIDALGESSEGGEPDCSRLSELEAASLELQAVIRAKSQHILARLEQESGGASAGAAAAPSAPAGEASAPRQPPAAPSAAVAGGASPAGPRSPTGGRELPAAAPAAPEAASPPPPRKLADAERIERAPVAPVRPQQPSQPPAAAPPAAPKVATTPPRSGQSGWSTETSERLPAARERAEPLPPPLPPLPPQSLPPITVGEEGFSRDEIREASRGFFGTISGGLATVLEHAFSTLGTPTGYVLGNEGGGAFIAGLRYGKGTLFLKDGSKREVYWHGPSIGYDFGASGSRTMFLVYNLRNEIDIFTGYSGVDGSAYLVGGVGMTVLTDGKVVMAPIRSGIGVRLGANIGYIRFTARPTWNPF
ncbi:MAG: DUF1134 domain-containing protein [Hyphomicrobiaceae bacterium]